MKYSFPKVDLHFHLDGSMVPETTWRLAKERGIKLPTETLEEFKKYLVDKRKNKKDIRNKKMISAYFYTD